MKPRSALAGGILLVWAGALGWLADREYGRPRSDLLAEAGLSIPPGTMFYRVALGDEQVGFASSTVDTLADTIRVQDVMVLELPVLGGIHRTDARTEAVLSRSLQLQGFRATVRGDGARFETRGEIQTDSTLKVTVETGEATRRTVATGVTGSVVLPGIVPLSLAVGRRLGVGRRYSYRVFDPVLLGERVVDIAVTAESILVVPDSARFDSTAGRWVPARFDSVHAWRVTQRSGGLDLAVWIDDMGRVVEATSAVGFRMERAAFELAFENFRRRDTAAAVAAARRSDLVRNTAIASRARIDGARLEVLRVTLGGVDLTGFDLDGARQRLDGDTVTIDVGPDAASRLAKDARGGARVATYVRPEPLIESDDPRIEAMARQIAGRRQADIPRRLNTWVFENVRKESTSGVPSAVAVLESRRGDCNEHTMLFVALARALGISARPVAGLVHVDGRFYYHSWPEYYQGGTWNAADPTFGQLPADASHVRLIIGGLARQVELVRVLGRLTVTVVEARNRP